VEAEGAEAVEVAAALVEAAAEVVPGEAATPRQLKSELLWTVTGATIYKSDKISYEEAVALTRVSERTRRITDLEGNRGSSRNVCDPYKRVGRREHPNGLEGRSTELTAGNDAIEKLSLI
jgi:hypothetical protein